MLRSAAALLALGGALLLPAIPALSAQEQASDIAVARAYFEQLRQLAAADSARLWGVRLDGPTLFADPGSRRVLANAPDSGRVLRDSSGIWVGTLPPEVNIANRALDWSGRRWTMIMWPLPDDRYVRGRLLMHESFHRVQPELGFEMPDPANEHLASTDARIWMRLEMRALAEALIRRGDERQRALVDALTFRARRNQLHPGSAEEEARLELNEGLSEYTGFVLSGLPRTSLPDRAAMHLATHEQRASFSRSFAYATGPAYALLLDDAAPGWRRRLSPTSDLAALAREAYGITSIDGTRAESLVAIHDGARMIATERRTEAERIAREQRYRGMLVDGPVVCFPIGDDFGYSFDPNNATALPGVGVVYESMRVSDSWGVLTVSAGGALLRRSGGLITGVAVPAGPGDDQREGAGWKLELASGWQVKRGSGGCAWEVGRGG